jgi:hypothetical protein
VVIVRGIIGEVVLEQKCNQAGGYKTYSLHEKAGRTVVNSEDDTMDAVLEEGYYAVDDIEKVHIDPKTHKEQYFVKYKGYSNSHNEWKDAADFNQAITFSTYSSSGRRIKRTTRNSEQG